METIVFGHRGIPSLAPENSLNSFSLLLEHNIPGVELDIHLTKDGELAIIHDFSTLKMTGVDYKVSETNYGKLRSLDIGDGAYIPKLHEVFELLGDKILYDLEIKSDGKRRKELVGRVLSQIERYNLNNSVIVSSFDPFLLREFNKLKSGIKTAIIYSSDDDVPLILRTGLGQLVTKCDIIKPGIKDLKGFFFFIYTKILRKSFYTWTVNSVEEFELAKKLGCKGICTNFPQNFVE